MGLQASLLLWGWLASQYPYFAEPELSIRSAAAPDASLRVILFATVVGAIIVVPSFVLLFRTFRKFRGPAADRSDAEG
ncbi:MAG: cytochrome d ubiquinol oxidase subunit II [Gemmatimonadota bacterium]